MSLATALGIAHPSSPAAWLAARGLGGAVAGADFRARRYWLPSLASGQARWASESEFFAQFVAASTTARAYFDAAGVLRADLAANQPRFSWPAGARRLVLEAALTNKTTCRKHNPIDVTNVTPGGDAAAVLSVVDDATALSAAGLSAVCTNGKVYKLDNSAGATTAVALLGGTTGNTNAHSFAAYARVSAGSATLRLSSGEGSVTFSNSAFALVKAENVTPDASGRTLALTVAAGGVLHFILPGLYEQSFAPHAPIIGDTAAAVTRAIETFRLPASVEAVLAGNAYSPVVRASVLSGPPVTACLLSAGAGSEANRNMLFISSAGHAYLLGATGGVTTVNTGTLGAAISAGELFGAAAAVAAADYAVDDSKSALVTSTAAGALPPVTSAYLGRRQDGGAFGNGLYDLFAVWPVRLPDARVQALAVPY